MLGVLSGGFERFFQQMGTPDFPRIQAAGQAHSTQFFRDFEWPDA